MDKPAGMTSHDVVDAVRKRLRTKKVGHAGTLDPDATGVLVLGVGRATRLLAFTQSAPKRYLARARFGVTTSTQDASGEVLSRRQPAFTERELEAAVSQFVGTIDQVPPMVSAVKVGGERLYKKARRGEDVERPARTVTIYELQTKDVDMDRHEVSFDVVCSGGTYIRTLVHDIGEALGCGGHLVSLRRTAAGGFLEDDALDLEIVDQDALRPLGEAVRDLQRVDIDEAAAAAVSHGRALPIEEFDVEVKEGENVAVFSNQRLLGVYIRKAGSLVADRVLAS
ncbi:MAG: tRNA pseudouridine(55) synthase TruB [Actinomycetota bacterium]|nr:tRNA pseudouridine(55) synthase TruB [Actinomycetota bacterium]